MIEHLLSTWDLTTTNPESITLIEEKVGGGGAPAEEEVDVSGFEFQIYASCFVVRGLRFPVPGFRPRVHGLQD